jgi:hypothetical protein
MPGGEPKDHEIFAQGDTSAAGCGAGKKFKWQRANGKWETI